jgi:hypothetical protein
LSTTITKKYVLAHEILRTSNNPVMGTFNINAGIFET